MSGKITKKEILDKSYILFKKYGFDNVSVDQVCKSCGITKPTFYKYVESKESMLTSFYDEVCLNIMINFDTVYRENTYYEQFHAFYKMIIDSSEKLGPALIGKMMSLNLLNDSHSFDTRENLTKIIILLIDKGKADGEFRSTQSSQLLYRACNYAFLGLEYQWSVRGGKIQWNENFSTIADCILQATK